LSSRPKRTRISYFTELKTTTYAALRKESRRNFINATELNRKSGGAKWRDLCVDALSWKCFSTKRSVVEGSAVQRNFHGNVFPLISLRQPEGDTNAKAIRINAVRRFIRKVRRSGQELVLVLSAHRPSIVKAIFQAAPGCNREEVLCPNAEGIFDSRPAKLKGGIRPPLRVIEEGIPRPDKEIFLRLAMISVELQETAFSLQTKMVVPIKDSINTHTREPQIATFRETRVHTGEFPAEPKRLAASPGSRHDLRLRCNKKSRSQ
jgi:hypothetical protein